MNVVDVLRQLNLLGNHYLNVISNANNFETFLPFFKLDLRLNNFRYNLFSTLSVKEVDVFERESNSELCAEWHRDGFFEDDI